MEITRELFYKLLNVLRFAEATAEHHEAFKHEKTNPQYIEVQLLRACKDVREHANITDAFFECEIIRQSDADKGGTDTDFPPLQGAYFNRSEKKWMLHTVRSEFFKLLSHLRCPFRFVPQKEGPHLLILEE
jgi:hypothetical protein